uniref:Elongation factor G n=1 Tax=candidate division CPR3 bacterium TaxID=2268181 RepID=A0A7C5YYZ2_UNCC3
MVKVKTLDGTIKEAEKIPLKNFRNIGIIAHIDAGKTTTTESFLYYTGMTYKIGSVDEGTTEMDWMEQERERGITITSAATTTFWTVDGEKYRINIIDTPGHVDFTAEVERSLRVLDGGVVVFDGKMGVEPQSETVWRQADKYNVPRICFVNKLNLIGGDFDMSVKSIKEKLNGGAIAIQYPVGFEKDLRGVVDIIKMKAYVYKDEEHHDFDEVEVPSDLQDRVKELRAELLDKIADADDSVMEHYLNTGDLSEEEIYKALRIKTLKCEVFPVLGGDGRRGMAKFVLDAIVRYLPSPIDRGSVKGTDPNTGEEVERAPSDQEPFCALAFKIVTDPHIGKLAYFRVYSGVLRSGESVYNSTRKKREKVSRLLMMHANYREEIGSAKAGDIAAIVGPREVKTGDTLCSEEKPILLEGIKFIEPIVSMAVEPVSKADQEKMGTALAKLMEEDPTFRVTTNQETGQTIIWGVGELHLEIMVDRLKREHHVNVNVGKPQVAYKETITVPAEAQGRYVRQTGGRGQYGDCWLRLEPLEDQLGYEFQDKIKGGVIPSEFIPEIEKGVKKAMDSGVLAGYPVVGVRVIVFDGSYHEVDSSNIAFQIAGSMAFKEAMKKAKPILLEPIMAVDVTTPAEYTGDVTKSIVSRRGIILGTEQIKNVQLIRAEVPLAELFGYVNELRSITNGRGAPSIEFKKYAKVPTEVQKKLLGED